MYKQKTPDGRFCFGLPDFRFTYKKNTSRNLCPRFEERFLQRYGLKTVHRTVLFTPFRIQPIAKTKNARWALLFWSARLDSNQRSTESESVALSSCATGRFFIVHVRRGRSYLKCHIPRTIKALSSFGYRG